MNPSAEGGSDLSSIFFPQPTFSVHRGILLDTAWLHVHQWHVCMVHMAQQAVHHVRRPRWQKNHVTS